MTELRREPTHALRQLTFYESGSTTEINTYADPACRMPNTIPIIADKDGEFGPIYLAGGEYRVRLQEPWGEDLWMVEMDIDRSEKFKPFDAP